MIPNAFVRDLRDRADIVEVVSPHVKLRRAGRSFVGLCPFHQEKTPSFNVNPERQIYHCFGCGKGGDAISFLMEFEGASFSEAVRDLAARLGVEVPQEFWRGARPDADADARRDRWHNVLDAAQDLFARTLRGDDPTGAPAREYVASRGLSREVSDTFGLGFAPPGWDRLVRHLQAGRHSMSDAEAVGLVVPRQGGDGWYDRFRGRLMFPVHDLRGRIVAFSGRILPGLETDGARDGVEAAKYVNSPETPLYRKGRSFLGVPQAKQAIRRTASAILVEGNFDLTAVHALGHQNVVAPLGTALTADQATVLRRLGAAAVVLLLDPDDAGRAAARRAFPVLAAAGLSVRWACLPGGRDPGDLLPAAEKDILDPALGGALPFVDRAIREAAVEAAGALPDARAAAARELAPFLAAVRDEGERDLYVESMATSLGINRHLVHRIVQGAAGAADAPRRPADAADDANPDHPAPASSAATPSEEALLAAVLARPDLARQLVAERLEEAVTHPPLARVLRHLAARSVENDGDVALVADDLLAALGDPLAEPWLRGMLIRSAELGPERAAEQFRLAVRSVRAAADERRAAPMGGMIRAAQAGGDDRQAIRLAQEKLVLRRKVKKDTLVYGSGPKR